MNYWWIIRFPILFASIVSMQIVFAVLCWIPCMRPHFTLCLTPLYNMRRNALYLSVPIFSLLINRSTFWFSWRSWRSFFPNYEPTTRVNTRITNFGMWSQRIFSDDKLRLFDSSVFLFPSQGRDCFPLKNIHTFFLREREQRFRGVNENLCG